MPLTLALIAHDKMKPALADWAAEHEAALRPHRLICTGTTGGVVAQRCPSSQHHACGLRAARGRPADRRADR